MHLQLENFLSLESNSELIKLAILSEKSFVPTNTATNEPDYRESAVLYQFPSELVTDKVATVIADVTKRLGMELFEASQIEAQLTAHNDGCYYRIHNDNGSPDTANRCITYVYYFYTEPKGFTGGELVIGEEKVEPINNSIVFFDSGLQHQVLSISCPSRLHWNGRFTVNGWIRG